MSSPSEWLEVSGRSSGAGVLLFRSHEVFGESFFGAMGGGQLVKQPSSGSSHFVRVFVGGFYATSSTGSLLRECLGSDTGTYTPCFLWEIIGTD